jgi:hypothetical protein
MAFILCLYQLFILLSLATVTQYRHHCNVTWIVLNRKVTNVGRLLCVPITELVHCLMVLLTYQVFDEYIQIRKHVRAFHGGRRFPCGLCEKEFPRPDKLKLHMLRCPALVAANWFSSNVLFARSLFAVTLCSVYVSMDTDDEYATVSDNVLLNVSILCICQHLYDLVTALEAQSI